MGHPTLKVAHFLPKAAHFLFLKFLFYVYLCPMHTVPEKAIRSLGTRVPGGREPPSQL